MGAACDRDRALEEICSDRCGWAVFLDIDGTLIDIADKPENVVVPAGLVAAIGSLGDRLGGAVALLTGRMIASADRLFHPLGLVSSGVHGTEMRLETGGPIIHLAQPLDDELVGAVEGIAAGLPGLLVERKGAGLTVHYRRAPQYAPRLDHELRALLAAQSRVIKMHHGRSVFEIGPSHLSKATALVTLAAHAPFNGRRPVMIGDDAGDEAALHRARDLGGIGLTVAGEHFPARTADFDGPQDVRRWIGELCARLG